MGVGIGSGGQAGIIKEASYGAGGTVDTFIELLTEGIRLNQAKAKTDIAFQARSHYNQQNMELDVGGPMSFIVNPDNIGLLMYMLLGVEANASQVVGTQAEITEITCEADVSGSLSGKYWTLSAPGTEYYVWYDVAGEGSADPAISGKTGICVGIAVDAANTAVASATATAITALGAFGASAASEVVTVTNAADGAVDDAADGDTGWTAAWTVTQQGSGGAAYDHVMTPAGLAVDLPSFALEIDRGLGDGYGFLYKGCIANTGALSASKGSFLQATIGVMGQQETDGVSLQSLTPSTKLAYTFKMGTVKLDSGAIAYMQTMDMSHDNMCEFGHVMDGNAYPAHIYKGGHTLTGTLGLEYTTASDTFRDKFRDNTQVKLEFIFTSTTAIESGYYYTLSIEVPKATVLEAFPNISGPGRVPFDISWEADYDSTNFVKVTLRDARSTKWSA